MKFAPVVLSRVAGTLTLTLVLAAGSETVDAATTDPSGPPSAEADRLNAGENQTADLETREDPLKWSDPLEKFVRRRLGPPLKALHEPVDAWLAGLPMWVAVAAAVGLYGIALIWVWTLSSSFVFRGAPDHRRWRDLRIWATVVVLPYVALYLWLGR